MIHHVHTNNLSCSQGCMSQLAPINLGKCCWPCFHHLGFCCFVLLPGASFSFLTHLYLLVFAFAVLLIAQTMPVQGTRATAMEENKPKNC